MHRGTRVARGALLGIAITLAAPAVASASSLDAYNNGVLPNSVAINSLWVIVAGCFVMFMQAGFAFLEIGFSRGKNVGTIVAKILVNFSIAAIMYYAIGFAFAFGVGDIIGHDGFFLRDYGDPQTAFPVMGLSDATVQSKWFFQFTFCAVSLAIVWGTTLERIKFGVYIIYAIVFAGFIYPIGSHWVFGGGWLQSNIGMQDFAGSTAVHMIGATGGLAVLLLLGPRRGKYGADGKPRAIPGHNMPLFGLAVLILWLGWFGFNPGSTLNAQDGRFTEILLVTQLAAAAGVITAVITRGMEDEVHRHRHGRATARSARSWPSPPRPATSSCGRRRSSAASPASSSRSRSTRSTSGSTIRWARSRRTAMAGIWGTLSCGLFTAPRLAQYNGFGDPDGGLIYSGALTQLGVPGARHRRRVHVRLRAVVPDVLG